MKGVGASVAYSTLDFEAKVRLSSWPPFSTFDWLVPCFVWWILFRTIWDSGLLPLSVDDIFQP